MKVAIIGTTKIAEIHVREFIQNKCKEITVISRYESKSIKLINKFKHNQKVKFFYSNIKILKKKKFDIIDICSNTNFHLYHLNLIPKFNGIILVEKPIFSVIKYKKNFLDILDKMYRKHKKIYVCYPMTYFARTLLKLKLLNFKNIKKFKVNYHTSGRHFYNQIGLDLLPHSISATLEFFNFKNFFDKSKVLNSTKIKKNKWSTKIKYKEFEIFYNFSQNKKRKTSRFSLQFNEKKLLRHTKKINNNIQNYVRFNEKMIRIENPMKIMFKDFFKNKNKITFFNKNRDVTHSIMKVMHNLI